MAIATSPPHLPDNAVDRHPYAVLNRRLHINGAAKNVQKTSTAIVEDTMREFQLP